MSMSEMLKGVQAAVDAHENAWHIQNRLMCLPKAVDHHHQKTIDLMKKEMGKLDEQLDQIDETLGRIFRDLVQPEDQGKIKAIRSHSLRYSQMWKSLSKRHNASLAAFYYHEGCNGGSMPITPIFLST